MNHQDKTVEHSGGYGTPILIWLGLVVLTGLTVSVSGINLKMFAVFTALLIASVKSFLVISYFMHLKYESVMFRVMVFVCLVTLAIFIGLTFFDILYR